MRTKYPTKDIEEYSWYIGLCATPDCEGTLVYYHYTPLENLNYIVKDECLDLRLTRADCFADKQEMRHVIPIFDKTCAKLLRNGCIDKDFFSVIKQVVHGTKSIMMEFTKRYIFCFSANGNSRYLIDNYACKGGKEGAVIGISGLALEDMQFTRDGNGITGVSGANIYNVIYDQEELETGFCEIIDQLYKMSEKGGGKTKAIERTINALMRFGLVYKTPPFAKEEETRLIVDVSTLTLPRDRFYQDDDRYLHIILPRESLYEVIEINK